jgi:hypothetical protein
MATDSERTVALAAAAYRGLHVEILRSNCALNCSVCDVGLGKSFGFNITGLASKVPPNTISWQCAFLNSGTVRGNLGSVRISVDDRLSVCRLFQGRGKRRAKWGNVR